jgi:TonB family protein
MTRNAKAGFVTLCAVVQWVAPYVQAQEPGVLFDEDVKMVRFADLIYPSYARMARAEGIVVVRVTLDHAGDVANAVAISGPRLLVPEAESNARKWKFRPNARAAAVIVYHFRIADGACYDGNRSLFLLRHQNLAEIVSCQEVLQ